MTHTLFLSNQASSMLELRVGNVPLLICLIRVRYSLVSSHREYPDSLCKMEICFIYHNNKGCKIFV